MTPIIYPAVGDIWSYPMTYPSQPITKKINYYLILGAERRRSLSKDRDDKPNIKIHALIINDGLETEFIVHEKFMKTEAKNFIKVS